MSRPGNSRYLSVFARIGCRKVAVPYDISILPAIADELETCWHRMLLIIEKDTKIRRSLSG
jgi:hypothetical protein